MESFDGIGLREGILASIKALGFEKPTPIQAKTIPALLEKGQDLIASAQTGTGKTAAFGLPAIQLTDIADKKTQTLVLSPTRELCVQITKDLQSYSTQEKGLAVVPVYGGSSIETQIRALKRGAQIVVATPGRAVDLINRKQLKLGNIDRLILDEADEMLTMGFKDDLDFIIQATPEERNIWLFSATMSRKIKDITRAYMESPLEIAAAKANTGASTVEHLYYMVHAKNKYEVLKRVADMNPNIYGIVFCRTRMDTKNIANKLIEDGYNADALHGDLSQAQRDEVMGRFRSKHLQMLVATDVASRGLDVNDLSHVINFNLPDDLESYVHRSGRTGRAGRKGISIAIINTRERKRIRDIERSAKIKFEQAPVPSGEEICRVQLYALIDRIQKIEVDEQQIAPFLPAIYEKLESLSREELIQHFVSAEFNTFLDYYKDARDLNVASSRERGKRGKRGKSRDVAFARMFINVGGKQKLTPPRLIGIINEALDSSTAVIGKIDIIKNFSFFDLEADFAKSFIKNVKGMKFEGIPLNAEISKNKPNSGGGGGRRNFKHKKKKKRW